MKPVYRKRWNIQDIILIKDWHNSYPWPNVCKLHAPICESNYSVNGNYSIVFILVSLSSFFFLSRIHHMSQLKMLNYLVHLLQCVAENFSRTMHRIQIISHKKCGNPEAVLPFNPIHTRSFTCGCKFKTNAFCFKLKYYFCSSAVKLLLLVPSWYTSFIMLIFVGNVFR